MKCHKCNKELPEGSLFCNYCGAEQIQTESSKQVELSDFAYTENRKTDYRRNYKIAAIAGVIGFVFWLFIGIFAIDYPVNELIIYSFAFGFLVAFAAFVASLNKKMLIGTVVVVAVMLGIYGYYMVTDLSIEEKIAIDAVEDYRDMLKAPDSMKLAGDVIVIHAYDSDDEYHTYCYFTASGNNSYGAAVSSTAYYRDYKYICDISSADEEDFTTDEEKLVFLDGKIQLSLYQLYGAESESFVRCEVVPMKKVAKRAKIDYAKN